ncbi:putative NBD/HSP70 family sugar kinase [Catenulispora sp. GP43]|uniref:ROK family protein n=1 Tax=Catenulispora sp. GP43 TaxID=3156263 RepID=UPI00351172F0
MVAPSIPGWTGLPMLSGLRTRLDCPVVVDNDVNLAARAEQQAGPAGASLLYVHWGERIGAGIVIDGKPNRGFSSAAGELGFLDLLTPIDARPAAVADGVGPFERLAGAGEIRRLALEACGPALPGRTAGHDLEALFTAAGDGNEAAAAA